MRRIVWLITIMLGIALVLAGCGQKNVEGVIEDLEEVVTDLKSYQAVGSMLLHTSQQPLEYSVEVWYQDPHYYRISLTNVNKDITQIVLRNDDGVFVLTPHLKKSFRFQSDWPDHQGQVYLYQTLVDSIMNDQQRQFAVDDDTHTYVFDVAANYENSSLVRQKVWLDQKNYASKQVEIYDENSNVMVAVEFDHFEFNKVFEDQSFDMDHNMTSWNIQSTPVLATTNEAMEIIDQSVDQAIGVFQPTYAPEGVQQVEISDITLGDQPGVLMRYAGEFNYTIVETKPAAQTVSVLPGTIIDLHYTLGVLTGDEHQMLRWIHDGVEFRLSTDDLPQSEMIKVAQSVQGQVGK